MILDSDGTARDVRIAADWRRRTTPDQVGAAVVAADTNAAENRARLVAEAIASTQDDPVDPPASTPIDPPSRARPVSDVTESALDAFDTMERFGTTTPAVTGISAEKAVRITIDQGRILACSIDPRWLVRQDETTLAHAIREALAAAALAQTEANRLAAEFSHRLTELLADVKATLHDIHREAGDRPS